MTESPRPFGMLGCLPGKIPVGLHHLTYYVAGDLPKAPAKVDVPEFGDWGMLGNDRYGDCGIAGLEHGFEVDQTITHEVEREISAAEAIEYYLDYTNGVDSGVVLADYLAHVREHGYYERTVSAYAPVAVHDIPTLQTAVWMYGFAYCGIAVTAGMQKAFGESAPWDSEACSGPILGGHCVPVVGYDDHFLYVITWGGVQAVTYSAWHSISTESWAVITGEFEARHGDGRGVSITALKNDLNKLNN
jgi:hypothetical protein